MIAMVPVRSYSDAILGTRLVGSLAGFGGDGIATLNTTKQMSNAFRHILNCPRTPVNSFPAGICVLGTC